MLDHQLLYAAQFVFQKKKIRLGVLDNGLACVSHFFPGADCRCWQRCDSRGRRDGPSAEQRDVLCSSSGTIYHPASLRMVAAAER